MTDKPKPFSYEQALCVQIEGALEDMNQANHELMGILKRVHDYLDEQGQKKGRASEEDGPPPSYRMEEERT
jgi:hypothetical protein